MEDMLDLLFNSEQYINDNILVLKTIIESLEMQKEIIIKSQAKFLNIYSRIESKGLKNRMKQQQNETFLELLKLDKKIEENKKILGELEKSKEEIF